MVGGVFLLGWRDGTNGTKGVVGGPLRGVERVPKVPKGWWWGSLEGCRDGTNGTKGVVVGVP